MIPFFDLRAVNAPYRAAIEAAIVGVMDAGQTILGPEVAEFEREFAGVCTTSDAIGVGNGLDALALLIRAYDFEPGSEIIVPAHTFIATFLAVSANGCVPVPAEPDPRTMLIDPSDVEALITPRTRAIIAVHLYGLLCDMTALTGIARTHGLRLIEDAAQAHGAVRDGRAAGGWADAAGFSFYPTKNLGALGDGGAVTTDDAVLAERVRMFRNYGSSAKDVHVLAGVNSRLDELQAAVLRAKLPHLEADNARRRQIAARYSRALADTPLELPPPAGEDHVHHLYVVRTPDRTRLRDALASAGIGTAVHYPTPPHLQPAYRGLTARPLPITERLAAQVVSLPMHPALSDGDVEHIIEVLRVVS